MSLKDKRVNWLTTIKKIQNCFWKITWFYGLFKTKNQFSCRKFTKRILFTRPNFVKGKITWKH